MNKHLAYKLLYGETCSADDGDTSQLPDHLFADGSGRKFPTHTKAATLASIAQVFAPEVCCVSLPLDQVEEIHGRVKSAAAFWGVTPQVEQVISVASKLKTASEVVVKDASAFSRFALDGKLPIDDAAVTMRSASSLVSDWDKVPYADRKSAAKKILAAIAEHGAQMDSTVDERLRIMSGDHPLPESLAKQSLKDYLSNTDVAPTKDLFDSTIACVDRLGQTEYQLIVEALDNEIKRTGSRLPWSQAPETALYSCTETAATGCSADTDIPMDQIKAAGNAPFVVFGPTAALHAKENGAFNAQRIADIFKSASAEQVAEFKRLVCV